MISLSLASDEHQMLVRKLMNHFESMGLMVTCACSGYVDCQKICGFEPDVRAHDNNTGLHYIGEAKTCDNLETNHTKKQFKLFANRIMTGGKLAGNDVPFYIIVPKKCKEKVADILKDLNLEKRQNIHVVT